MTFTYVSVWYGEWGYGYRLFVIFSHPDPVFERNIGLMMMICECLVNGFYSRYFRLFLDFGFLFSQTTKKCLKYGF